MSRVAVVKYTARTRPFLEKEEYEMLLRSGLNLLADNGDYMALLRRLMPKGTIGLKTNCLAAWNPTLMPLVNGLAAILIGAIGVDDNEIVVWERTGRELKRAGYELNASSFGMRCLGTDTNGVGYDDEFQSSGNVNSLVTRILTRLVDHSINLPVLKDHSIAGLSAGLKNMYGAIHNPNKYHAGNCSPSAAHINNLSSIRDKHRLTIIDAVRIQYDRGPAFDKNYMAYFDGVILAADPVAADRISLEILDHLRIENSLMPLSKTGRPVRYLAEAEKLGLGKAELKDIDLRVVYIDGNGGEKAGELF